MSNRKLVLLPFALTVLYALLPFMPQPRPLPPGVSECIGCNEPVWLSEPVHMLVGLLMFALFVIVLVKLCVVLATGKLPNHVVFRTLTPILWIVFFATAAFYLCKGVSGGLPVTPYDSTSLIPYGFFAATDFVFAARLRKTNKWPGRRMSPWFEMP